MGISAQMENMSAGVGEGIQSHPRPSLMLGEEFKSPGEEGPGRLAPRAEHVVPQVNAIAERLAGSLSAAAGESMYVAKADGRLSKVGGQEALSGLLRRGRK